jgi:ribonuclease P protein component
MSGRGLRFPRAARLLKKAQFDAVFSGGLRQHSGLFRAHVALGTGAPARLGLAVAKRAVPNAAARNRVRRHAREAFRLRRAALHGVDLILVPKDAARDASARALRDDLAKLLERVATLNRPARPGTIAG